MRGARAEELVHLLAHQPLHSLRRNRHRHHHHRLPRLHLLPHHVCRHLLGRPMLPKSLLDDEHSDRSSFSRAGASALLSL